MKWHYYTVDVCMVGLQTCPHHTNVCKICCIQVHILGADRLLAVVPNRDPRKTISLAMVSPDGKLGDRTGSSKRKSGYNRWNAEENLSGKYKICCLNILANEFNTHVNIIRTSHFISALSLKKRGKYWEKDRSVGLYTLTQMCWNLSLICLF